jgi:hypothetical protein
LPRSVPTRRLQRALSNKRFSRASVPTAPLTVCCLPIAKGVTGTQWFRPHCLAGSVARIARRGHIRALFSGFRGLRYNNRENPVIFRTPIVRMLKRLNSNPWFVVFVLILFVAPLLVIAWLDWNPSVYADICNKPEGSDQETCASYHIILAALWRVLEFFHHTHGAWTALATAAIAWFTWTLRNSTERLWQTTVKGDRPWVGLETTLPNKFEAGRDVEVWAHIKNAGRSRTQNECCFSWACLARFGGLPSTSSRSIRQPAEIAHSLHH